MHELTLRSWPNTNKVRPMAVMDSASPNTRLVAPGVVSMVELAGTSSLTGKTGAFIPAARLSTWVASGKALSARPGPQRRPGLERGRQHKREEFPRGERRR